MQKRDVLFSIASKKPWFSQESEIITHHLYLSPIVTQLIPLLHQENFIQRKVASCIYQDFYLASPTLGVGLYWLIYNVGICFSSSVQILASVRSDVAHLRSAAETVLRWLWRNVSILFGVMLLLVVAPNEDELAWL